MPIPTEPIGSIPRPASLIEAMRDLGTGRIAQDKWRSLCDQAVRDTIERFETTGSPVITDGEQTKPSFATYPIQGGGPRPPLLVRRSRRSSGKSSRMNAGCLSSSGPPLVPLGYRIVAGDGRSRVQTAGQRTTPLPKRLKCPRCDRRFSHRLHVARHMSATHGRK